MTSRIEANNGSPYVHAKTFENPGSPNSIKQRTGLYYRTERKKEKTIRRGLKGKSWDLVNSVKKKKKKLSSFDGLTIPLSHDPPAKV